MEYYSIKKLIINADDFGLSQSINSGILDGYLNGVITSTSLFAAGAARENAVEIIRKHSGLDLGVHLTLTQGKPVLNSEKIKTLIQRDGFFPPTLSTLAKRLLLRKINFNEVYKEFDAQISKIARLGFSISHLDVNQHIHFNRKVFQIVVSLAEKYCIPFVRTPCERSSFLKAGFSLRDLVKFGCSFQKRSFNKILEKKGIFSTDHFTGLFFSGKLTAVCLLELLRGLRPGLTEIVCHPGEQNEDLGRMYAGFRAFNWEDELNAIKDPSVAEHIKTNNVMLTNFSNEAKLKK